MVICFVCPFLSLGYILSLFSKVRASTKLALSYGKDVYVFSQLNEESITFASDISQNHPKAGIIFCDVIDSSGGESNPFSDRAEQLNATCLNKPITAVNFKLHSKKRRVYFFCISDNEQANTNDALELIGKYKNLRHTRLYFFSTLLESQLVLANCDSGYIRVRRVDKARTFINRFLYDNGQMLFEHAAPPEKGESEKRIICSPTAPKRRIAISRSTSNIFPLFHRERGDKAEIFLTKKRAYGNIIYSIFCKYR